jgi:hypothetical protein
LPQTGRAPQAELDEPKTQLANMKDELAKARAEHQDLTHPPLSWIRPARIHMVESPAASCPLDIDPSRVRVSLVPRRAKLGVRRTTHKRPDLVRPCAWSDHAPDTGSPLWYGFGCWHWCSCLHSYYDPLEKGRISHPRFQVTVGLSLLCRARLASQELEYFVMHCTSPDLCF